VKRESTPFTDERLARSGLAGYLRYMKRRGLTDARDSLWVQKVAAALGKTIREDPDNPNPQGTP
jgi:hypothetical protein